MSSTDIYSRVTERIIEQISNAELGGWSKPWLNVGGSGDLPKNAVTGKAYNGINTVMLWIAAQDAAYASSEWATYRQWASVGAQVKKHEKGSQIVFYKTLQEELQDTSDETTKRRIFATTSHVFNSSQVDGYKPTPPPAPLPTIQRLEAADAYLAATGVPVIYGGNKAFYRPSTDIVHLPRPEQFKDTASLYATATHEICGHATGHPTRLNREFGKRFGDKQYSFEEIIAECASAFACARLGIENVPRADHAQYVKHWVEILAADNRAIFTAASAAQKAIEWCDAKQTGSHLQHDLPSRPFSGATNAPVEAVTPPR